jgi:hypothetical protein
MAPILRALLHVCVLVAAVAPALASGDVQSHINIGFRPADTTVAQNGLVVARYLPNAPNPVVTILRTLTVSSSITFL